MYSTRIIKLLLVALSILAIAQATYIDVKIIDVQSHEIVRRQDDKSATDDSSSSSPSSTPDTSKTSETSTPTSTPTPSETTSKTPTSKPSPTTTDKSPTSTEPTESSPTRPPETSSIPSSIPGTTVTHIVTKTNEDGSKSTFTSKSTTAPTAGLQDGSGKNPSSGMPPQTRNIVIGVVVGVGGAIVLGGIALVAYRIWGRKKNQNDNADMDYDPGYQPVEKSEAGNSPNGRSPFQSTLESYHAPTQVNQASNF